MFLFFKNWHKSIYAAGCGIKVFGGEMGYVMFFALSAIAAMLFTPVYNFVSGRATSVASSNSTAASFLGSYFGKTAVTTIAFFVVILAAATVMNFVGGKKAASVPEVV